MPALDSHDTYSKRAVDLREGDILYTRTGDGGQYYRAESSPELSESGKRWEVMLTPVDEHGEPVIAGEDGARLWWSGAAWAWEPAR